jgi:hypothetical protein
LPLLQTHPLLYRSLSGLLRTLLPSSPEDCLVSKSPSSCELVFCWMSTRVTLHTTHPGTRSIVTCPASFKSLW